MQAFLFESYLKKVLAFILLILFFICVSAGTGSALRPVTNAPQIFSSLESRLRSTQPVIINDITNNELRAGKLAEIQKDGSFWTLYKSVHVAILIESLDTSLENANITYYLEGLENLHENSFAKWEFERWGIYFIDGINAQQQICGIQSVDATANISIISSAMQGNALSGNPKPKFVYTKIYVPYGRARFRICNTNKNIRVTVLAVFPRTPQIASFELSRGQSSAEIQLGQFPGGEDPNWVERIKRALNSGYATMYDAGDHYDIYWWPKFVTTGSSNAEPKIISLMFRPEQPTTETRNISCCVSIQDPDSDSFTYKITWYVRLLGSTNFQYYSQDIRSTDAKNYCTTLSVPSSLANENIDKIRCFASVSDGKREVSQIGEVSVVREYSTGTDQAAETDSDNDGVPDSADRCPYQRGDPANHGCPAEQQSTQSAIPEPGKDVKVLFIFMPIDWRGSDEKFKEEVNANIESLKEASGCGNDLNYYALILPRNISEKHPECDITLQKCINTRELANDIRNCVESATGFTLNRESIIFVGISDRSPLTNTQLLQRYGLTNRGNNAGFIMEEGGQCKLVNASGFHVSPLVTGNIQTKVVITLADRSVDPVYQTMPHELGHCLGFCEQYSIAEYIKQRAINRFMSSGRIGCTNKFPGAYSLSRRNNWLPMATVVELRELRGLFGITVQPVEGFVYTAFDPSVPYETCPEEIPSTHCPEYVVIERSFADLLGITEFAPITISFGSGVSVQGAIVSKKELALKIQTTMARNPQAIGALRIYMTKTHCLGRRISYGGGQARDIMGPTPATLEKIGSYIPSLRVNSQTKRLYDCFEREVVREAWCG